ncbi:hypothetical protein AVEN_97461-1 [Araneus ventricosus]|uniref:Uncharacterized protein n=1 Tax=Araneus ventricosus TaxID=182803 RepID=A0A4Y2P7S9_ARAVE|nr:hypothetical protein AVEN_97461-1 [Araneus ventricosus]
MQIIHGCSKVCFETRSKSQILIPTLFPPHEDLNESLNLGSTFVSPLPSQRGPQKAIRPFQSDFKLFGIPTLPILYANFHRFLTPTIGFSFPCSKYSSVQQL